MSISTVEIFEDKTASAVHEKAIKACADGQRCNVICTFPRDGLDEALATKFPFRAADERPAVALDEVVMWWQATSVPFPHAARFNHGSRIRGRDEDWNQLPQIVEVLISDPLTTKGHVTVQHPRPGYADSHGHPSLCEIFFGLRTENGHTFLDITATFRKQELRYWWIVNVKELSYLLDFVLKSINEKDRNYRAGQITTFAFRALVSEEGSVPEVAVPALDRAQAFRPQDVRNLAASLTKKPFAGNVVLTWKHYLEDLVPRPKRNPDGFPVCIDGLQALVGHLHLLESTSEGKGLDGLATILENLLKLNEETATALEQHPRVPVTPTVYELWRKSCDVQVRAAGRFVEEWVGLPNLFKQP